MAITEAIWLQLLSFVLATVNFVFSGDEDRYWPSTPTVISTTQPLFRRDATPAVIEAILLYNRIYQFQFSIRSSRLNTSVLLYPFRFYTTLSKMADNLRRAVKDIDLGAEDVPFALPAEIVAQAAAENRFILMGRPVMPRRQNTRAIVAAMPQIWGQSGLVHGRLIPNNQFQFIFPTEESLENVIRRGPWAFNDRMLILQRWSPMNQPLINFIPFWIQIRGIPYHYLNREVTTHIGRALGNLMEVDFDPETAARVEFVCVQVNWNVEDPLRFQRNFQFEAGVNTLLRFRFERLRGFCEVCGMLTHDSGACLIQNGGGEDQSDDEDAEDNHPPTIPQNQGVVIREIEDDEENGVVEEIQPAAVMQEDDAEGEDTDPNHNGLIPNDDLADHLGSYSMFNEERNMSELLNPIPFVENATGDIPGNASYQHYSPRIHPNEDIMETTLATQDTPASARGKRKREEELIQSTEIASKGIVSRETGEGSGSSSRNDQCRGAVGPNPPHSP